jgi:ribosomal protein S18 acetylase RimI-like enzyme
MTNEQIIYRKADSQDLQILIDFRVEFLIDFWGDQQKESILELALHLRQYFIEALSKNDYTSFIAFSGKKVVGIGGIIYRQQPGNFRNPTGRVGYIVNMYTIPEYRRMGIGSTILQKLTDDAADRGITLLELHATKEGETVYIKHDFKIHSEPTYRKFISI